MTAPKLTAPAAISPEHRLDDFACGEPALDDWLKRRALKNHASGASRCFVICHGVRVVGYYSLSAGGVSHVDAPKPMRRNMPDPIPILLLGRLAIDRQYHNQGLGSALLRDAMLRSLAVAGNAGVAAILIHAISDPAKQFYLSRGFVPSPLQPMTLMMTLETIRSILREAD